MKNHGYFRVSPNAIDIDIFALQIPQALERKVALCPDLCRELQTGIQLLFKRRFKLLNALEALIGEQEASGAGKELVFELAGILAAGGVELQDIMAFTAGRGPRA